MVKRTLFLVLTVLLMIAGSASPVVAKDNDKHDNKSAAEACKKDGWESLTDEDGDPFKNQGQCVKYAKQGGELVARDQESTPEVKDAVDEPIIQLVDGQDPWDGYLVGDGFTPGEEITKVTFESDRETLELISPVGTQVDDDGAFQTERIIYWCSEYDGYGETSGTVTVEDSAGVSSSQEFEMDTHCAPKE